LELKSPATRTGPSRARFSYVSDSSLKKASLTSSVFPIVGA
jgi:hypothetical protein